MSFPQFYDCRLEDDRQLPMEPGRKEGREMHFVHFVHLGPGLAFLPYYLSKVGVLGNGLTHSCPPVLTRQGSSKDGHGTLPSDPDGMPTDHNPASRQQDNSHQKVKTKPLLSVGDCALLAWHGAAVLTSITHRSPPWIPASSPRVPRLPVAQAVALAPYCAVFLLQSPTLSSPQAWMRRRPMTITVQPPFACHRAQKCRGCCASKLISQQPKETVGHLRVGQSSGQIIRGRERHANQKVLLPCPTCS
ncbi:hypothetical protein CCHR01_19891 [Colletotrichum chrysophilum]|uniref:Uncharacterized protein n=1 Tax=Colletotrichum chrysophilum TaxID=1836956 RepID=A0AAD8ZZR1_9PEZI|nr:hypothetical protein CCHR01_19891 [Colletotrichum chrysophilum]